MRPAAADADGDALAVTVAQGGNGAVSVANGTITYTPAADFSG